MNFSEIFPGVIFSQFSPNGQYLVLSNGTKIIIKDVEQLTTIPFNNSQFADATIQQIEISPNSEMIAISYPKRGYVEIKRLDDQSWIGKIEDNVETIMWCPDSIQLIVVSEFQIKASIYNLSSKGIVHLKNPKQLCFSHCGRFMVMSERRDAKDQIGVYSTKDWKLLNYCNSDTLDCVKVEWSYNDSFIGIQDSELNYRMNLHCPCQGLLLKYEAYQHALGIKVSRFAHQNDMICLGGNDEKLRILNLLTLKLIVELDHKITKETIIYKEEEYADQYTQRVVTKYSQLENNIKLGINKQQNGLGQLEWSYKDDYIATKIDSTPNCVYIWDVETLTLKAVLIQLLGVKQFIWSKCSTHLTICCGNSKLFFWSPHCTSVCDMPFDKSFHVLKLDWSNDQKSLLLQDKSDVVVAYPQLEDSF